MNEPFTRLNYCQFLLSSQTNYTLTYLADHAQQWSHDLINRYLADERLTPRLIWEQVEGQIVRSERGYVMFDDTVLDKGYSQKIGMVRRQYSGNAKAIIKGIGVVNCVYVNPETGQFWIIDYRIYDPDGDGKSKLHHVHEMVTSIVAHKALPFAAVLMDSWYAVKWVMREIERLGKLYYCPVKSNRLINESGEKSDYHRVDALTWTEEEQTFGKKGHLKGFPQGHQVKLFRLPFSAERTEYVVTNDPSQLSAVAVQEACGCRWNVEQFHREEKQLTGIEACQCRKARIQRNHISCAIAVWVRLKAIAYQTQETVYQLKQNLLSNYMIQQLRRPTIKMAFA